MPQFLYTVTDVFDIAGRFIVAAPGVPPQTSDIRKDAPLELRRPDGSILSTHIAAIEMVSPYDPKRPIMFSFPPGFTKQDVPAGTEIWLSDGTSAA